MLTLIGTVNENLFPVQDNSRDPSRFFIWRYTLPYPMDSDHVDRVDRGYAVAGSAIKSYPEQARHISNALVRARHRHSDMPWCEVLVLSDQS